MKPRNLYVGINIQWPISTLILNGKKIIETRTYPIPKSYVGKELLLIETPGRNGGFKARIVAVIRFGDSFKYENRKQFYKDFARHLVDEESPWAWNEKGKWGWPIEEIIPFQRPIEYTGKKGIRFTKDILFDR